MESDLSFVKKMVLDKLDGYKAKVYLFGSFARGEAWHGSDIDVGILPLEPLPIGFLSELSEILEESSVLYSVDLVDLSHTDSIFRKRIEKEGILWRD
ncbi:MAG: nucleotidyltransferase domain-containing protein [Firmicutes bacterium]|jgi:predicted nucleotidyltransferase|nr:nucleotidyltransferase domain-containing protein [Bacillota bacterium]